MTVTAEQAREELWKASLAQDKARKRRENRWAWVRHFDRMAESHARLSKDYERRAEELFGDEQASEKGRAA